LESDQKDLYISELKAENFELRHRSGLFYDLRDRISGNEHEISVVNDDRRRLEDEMKLRKVDDDRIIRNIHGDNDGLKGTISARDAEIEDLKAQIEGLRREDNDLTADIAHTSKDNEHIKRDIDGLEHQLGDERGIGRRLRADLDKAKSVNTIKDDENHSAMHAIKVLEDDLSRNKINEADLARILADKGAELEEKSRRLHALEDEVARLRADIDLKDKEAHDLNHKYSVQLDMTTRERNELDRQISRNAELDDTVRRLEDELAHLEKDIALVRADVDRLRRIFEDADIANKGLEDELNALNKHAQLLESQNVELTKDLDEIIVTDERIRADLDRKHRVANLQHRNDEEIRESINRLRYTRSRSPHRSVSPHRNTSPHHNRYYGGR
jgi:chromosome segregation ATPase